MATIPFPTNPIGSTESIPTRRPIRLLGVWAHPDDEAYLSAGLMARVIQAGGQVTVLTATLGELGFPDDDTRSLADKAGQRDAEMRAAMAEIGVHDVRFMRWADGEVADLCVFDPEHYWTPGDDSLVSIGRHAPVTGREVPGVVRFTLADGKVAWRHPVH